MLMRRSRLIALFLGYFCLAFTLQAQDTPKAAKSPRERIQKRSYDFKDAGQEMEYALFVPTTYNKERKTPLMLALHGLGSNPQQMIRYRGLVELAEKHGYIVAAPMGWPPCSTSSGCRRTSPTPIRAAGPRA